MQSTAQGWLVYSLTRSPLYLGIVATAASLPVLLFTLLGGVVADRFRKRNLLIITQSLSILPALLLGLMTQIKIITPLHIITIAFFLGIVNAFDLPARQSFLVEMVQKGRLMNAIALNSAAFNGARIIGPLIAGLTIASIGIAACFYLNALSYLAAIIALLRIKGLSFRRIKTHGKGTGRIISYFHDLFEGLRFIKNNKDIFRVMIIVATFSLFGIPFVTLLPVFAEDILRVGAKGLGYLGGASGLGAFTAAFIIAYKGEIKVKGLFMSLAGLVFSISLFSFSMSRDFYLSLVLLVLAGWGIVSFLAIGNSLVQLTVKDELRGRVMSVYTLLFLGLSPIGNSLIGLIANIFGSDRAITTGSCICIITMLMLMNKLRSIRV